MRRIAADQRARRDAAKPCDCEGSRSRQIVDAAGSEEQGPALHIRCLRRSHFSYPKGLHVGNIYRFASPAGLCSDQKGDVFVTDTPTYHVYEYAHGSTKRLKTLYDNYIDFGPIDCSVDPTTGNVAVASADTPYVVVFPRVENKPRVYGDSHTVMYRLAYDDKGNLFVDQRFIHRCKECTHNYIGEPPKGATKFENFLLDKRILVGGGIQFDGEHVAIEDLPSHVVYRLRFSGPKAIIIVGNTPLKGTTWVEQFWVQGKTLIGPDENSTVYFWKYPEGGSPASSVGGFTLNYGSTVSVAPS
jgi:hypothetical protein